MKLKKLSKRFNREALVRRYEKIARRQQGTQVTQEKDRGTLLVLHAAPFQLSDFYRAKRIDYPIRNARIQKARRLWMQQC